MSRGMKMLTIPAGRTNSALLHLSTLSVPCTTFCPPFELRNTISFDADWYIIFGIGTSAFRLAEAHGDVTHNETFFDEGEGSAHLAISACWYFRTHRKFAEELLELKEASDFPIQVHAAFDGPLQHARDSKVTSCLGLRERSLPLRTN